MSNNGWMPIETAPKDGSEVLLLGRGQAVGFWCDDENHWLTDYRGKGNFEYVSATHWQPLPASPTGEDA